MTKQEEKVLEIIKNNPFIEQAEIAKVLGIKRSTVGVHISNLQKHGYITGKGYILSSDNYVLGIGAANVDVYGKSRIKIRPHYDHPADIGSNVGGVTKNILTNISKLGYSTKLITAIGDDGYGDLILKDCKLNDIDSNNVIVVPNASSGVFMQIQDENNDMHMALCDMSVLEHITPDYINSKKNLLLNSKLVFIDSSLRLDTLEKIIEICKNKVPIYIDPISDNYAEKIKDYVGEFTCIKPNRTELEALYGSKLINNSEIYKACEKLISKGLNKIFVSLGKDGLLYMDAEGNKIIKKLKPVTKMVNASGAGDATMAAIIYGTVNGLKIEETIDYALAAGIAAITSSKTINDNMSIKLLNKILKENKYE